MKGFLLHGRLIQVWLYVIKPYLSVVVHVCAIHTRFAVTVVLHCIQIDKLQKWQKINAGKTVFVGALCHELLKRVGDNHLFTTCNGCSVEKSEQFWSTPSLRVQRQACLADEVRLCCVVVMRV